MILTLRPPRTLPRRLHRGQQQCQERPDDCDDCENFDQSYAISFAHGQPAEEMSPPILRESASVCTSILRGVKCRLPINSRKKPVLLPPLRREGLGRNGSSCRFFEKRCRSLRKARA